MEKALHQATVLANNLLSAYGPFHIEIKRHAEKAPHPTGQVAFVILVKFLWQPTPLCRIKIEITHDETVILAPKCKPILHNYDEALDYKVMCYHIAEIIAEKLHALLQTHQKLIARGWNRPRARDYYDLWFILKNYITTLNQEKLLKTLKQKCEHRNVTYKSLDDFFTDELVVKEAHQHWHTTLGEFIRDLPACIIVLDETRILINELL